MPKWQEVHESFVAQGWAGPYYGDDDAQAAATKELDTDGIIQLGVMSSYAAKNVYEDIAEHTMWAIMGTVYEEYGLPVGPRDRL